MRTIVENGFDRAVAAEQRRCERLGLVFDQPSSWHDRGGYGVADVIELRNIRGLMATYRISKTGRVIRMQDEA